MALKATGGVASATGTGTGTSTGTIGDVYLGVLPFIACMVVVLGVLIAFPGIVTWFPNLVKGEP